MKRYLIAMVAVITVLAIAVPTFALELKYGGLYRARLNSKDNVSDGQDGAFVDLNNPVSVKPFGSLDDNGNWIDQRVRMYFTFVGSENLQLVTRWEADTLWGNETPGAGRSGGGDIGADAVNLEMKNAYIDFALPMTTARATVGVQHMALFRGWIFDDDFSGALITGKVDPLRVQVGYVAAANENVTTTDDDVNEFFLNLEYAAGPLKAGFITLYQDGNEFNIASTSPIFTVNTIDPGLFGNGTLQGGGPFAGGAFGTAIGGVSAQGNAIGATNNALDFVDEIFGISADNRLADDQHFFDLGINIEYKLNWMSAYLTFIKNFGSWDRGNAITGLVDANGESLNWDDDFDGWFLEASASAYCGPWTFTLGGFVASGGDITDPDDFDDFFRYPAGAGHYWSEILGNGSLDVNTGGNGETDGNTFNMGYSSRANPSNLWTVQVGAAYQLLKGTKATLNYWYVGSVEPVVSDATLFFTRFINNGIAAMDDFETDSSIGHELDFYLDQKVVDGLNLRLVAAYLFANEGYTILPDDDDTYELGAVLMWSF